MTRREFLGLLLIGCSPEKIEPMKASRIFASFLTAPAGASYSTEYQAVLDRALALGTVWTSTTQNATATIEGVDGAEVVQLGNYVYILGGWQDADSPPFARPRNTQYRAHISDLTSWTQLSNAPWSRRHTFGCGVLGSKIYVWGADPLVAGHDCWSATQDGNGDLTWTQIQATLPYSNRSLAGTCVHNGYLYTIGGEDFTDQSLSPPTDVWRSADGITWTKVGDGISSFGGNMAGSSVSFNGYIYVFGGGRYMYNTSPFTRNYKDTVYRSSDGVSWTLVANINGGTGGFQYTKAVVYDDKIWLLSCVPGDGYAGFIFKYMDENETFTDPTVVNNAWSNAGYHAVAGFKLSNGNLAYATGTKNGVSTQRYFATIAKSYVGYDAPTETQKGYQNTLMTSLKDNGLLTGATKQLGFWVSNYGSSGFSTINWVTPASFQLTRNNTPTWTDGIGFQGNGSNMSLIPSGLVPSSEASVSDTNFSIYAYCANDITSGLLAIFGGDRNNTNRLYLAPNFSGTQLASAMFGTTDVATNNSDSSVGLWHMKRDNASDWKIYRNRVLVATVSGTSSSANLVSRIIFLASHTSLPYRFSDAQLVLFGCGPAIDNDILNDIVDQYKTLSGF